MRLAAAGSLLTVLIVTSSRVVSADAQSASNQPQVTLEITDLDPPSPATLHRGEPLFVRIKFDTSIPVLIWAVPISQGKQLQPMRFSPSPRHMGQGETLASFEFDNVTGIDTVHVWASRTGRDPVATNDRTVNYTWDGQPGPAPARAPWVAELRADANRRMEDDMRASSQAGAGGFGIALMGVFGVVVLGSIVFGAGWPIWGAVRWQGGWRIASAIPLAAVVLWFVKDAVDLAADPTSHNLLPFEMVEAAVLTLPYMIVVALLRRARLKKSDKVGQTGGKRL